MAKLKPPAGSRDVTAKLKLPEGCVWAQDTGKTTIIIKDDPDAWLVTESYEDGNTEILFCTNPDKAKKPRSN
jgi:hypothetical protein